jgi:type I restriction enzyme, S subunit
MSNVFEMKVNLWKDFPLSDLVDCLDGARRPIKKEDRENIAGGYPYFGASGIIDFVNDYIFDEELILLGEDGENVVSRNLPLAFKITGRNWVNNHAHVLKPKRNHDIDFLVYKLESRDYTDIISGSAQPKINQQNLMKLIFRIPEQLSEQRQIAYILSTADAVIEKTQATIAKYITIKQGMLHDLFARGIDISTGKLRPKYKDAPELYKESKLGMIPKEWEVENFEEATEIITDFTANGSFETLRNNVKYFYEPNYARLIRLTDLRVNMQNDGVYVNQEGYEFLSKSSLKENDIMLANVGEYTGFACLMPKVSYPATIAPNMFLVRANHVLFNPLYLYYFMVIDAFTRQVDNVSASSATKLLNKTNFRAMSLFKPTLIEQEIIGLKLKAIDTKVQTEQNYLLKLQKIKTGLMSDLLSGRKKVHVDTTADKDKNATPNNVIK